MSPEKIAATLGAPPHNWHAIDLDRRRMVIFSPPSTPEAPRRAVCEQFGGHPLEGVAFTIAPDIDLPPDGTDRPDPVLCRSIDDPLWFRVFKFRRDVPGSGFIELGKQYAVLESAELERFREALSDLDRIAAQADESDTAETWAQVDRYLGRTG